MRKGQSEHLIEPATTLLFALRDCYGRRLML
jgi:hypothetical protein